MGEVIDISYRLRVKSKRIEEAGKRAGEQYSAMTERRTQPDIVILINWVFATSEAMKGSGVEFVAIGIPVAPVPARS